MTKPKPKPSSRRQTTNYNRYERVRRQLADVYARAHAYHLSHDRILALRDPILKSNDYRRLTTYYRGYIAGLQDGWMRECWTKVVWRLGPASGPTRTAIRDAWTEEMSELSRRPGELYGGHYWLTDAGEITDKEFTAYAVINPDRIATGTGHPYPTPPPTDPDADALRDARTR